jgi:phosphate transport system protein
MPRLIDLGLEKITSMILEMAQIAETAIINSLKPYQQTGYVASEENYRLSEQLRFLQQETSRLSIEILARYQPLASDLRFVQACIDIAYDLARFGRYAYDIAETPVWFGDVSSCDINLPMKMAHKAVAMIKKSMDAFVRKDAEVAKTLPIDDNVIDHEWKKVILSMLNNDQIQRECALAITLFVRHIERIADHACYIADAVVYIVEGERLGLH